MFYEPKKGSPFKIDPFKSLIFPRPIGWISSISKNGIANLAPYSYFNAVADEPPQVMFCSNGSSAHGKYKDSLSVIRTTFDRYYVNDNWIQGERILTNNGSLAKPIQSSEILRAAQLL